MRRKKKWNRDRISSPKRKQKEGQWKAAKRVKHFLYGFNGVNNAHVKV
jgi:hypothetical protein